MPSISGAADRHVVIDSRPGHYLCFPDVCPAEDGTLLCVYNEFDRHVGTRRRLLLKTSGDGGRTWSAPRILNAADSHCPRLTRLTGGLLVITDDAGPQLYWSLDNGGHWAQQPGGGLGHGLIDRVLELTPEMLFTTGHFHRASQPQPKIGQPPSEQMAYLSFNRGRTWQLNSIIASEKCLVLCEASVIRLPDAAPPDAGGSASRPPRLLALMRENSFVGEPMYFCVSGDGGNTWGEPRPAPFIGHRPTLGWTHSGRLLVTYRDVGPDPGTKAWLGTLEELMGTGFAVHGAHPQAGNPRLTSDGLFVRNAAGLDSAVRYFLRPLTDPESASAEFFAEVLVRQSGENGCGVHFGTWWHLFPEGLRPEGLRPDTSRPDGESPSGGSGAEAPEEALVPWERGRFHVLHLVYEPGLVRLLVDGRFCGAYPVDRMSVATRPILVGAVARKTENACEAVWRRMALSIREPRLGRRYDWSWDAKSGTLPDAWIDGRVLELDNARFAAAMDFGYSGWAELSPGRFFCAYHHPGGTEPEYREGFGAHVRGAWFTEEDFGAHP